MDAMWLDKLGLHFCAEPHQTESILNHEITFFQAESKNTQKSKKLFFPFLLLQELHWFVVCCSADLCDDWVFH